MIIKTSFRVEAKMFFVFISTKNGTCYIVKFNVSKHRAFIISSIKIEDC